MFGDAHFTSVLCLSVHAPTKSSNTLNFEVFIRLIDKLHVEEAICIINKALDESNL